MPGSPSPTCTVNATSTLNGVNVPAATDYTIALADTAGVRVWSITCLNTDELLVASTVTAGLTVDYVGMTAGGLSPAAGSALVFQSRVNNGLDENGVADPSLTTTFGVYVLTSASLRVGAFDEVLEGSSAFGWVVKLNQLIRAAGGGGSGIGPVAVAGTPTAEQEVVAIDGTHASWQTPAGGGASRPALRGSTVHGCYFESLTPAHHGTGPDPGWAVTAGTPTVLNNGPFGPVVAFDQLGSDMMATGVATDVPSPWTWSAIVQVTNVDPGGSAWFFFNSNTWGHEFLYVQHETGKWRPGGTTNGSNNAADVHHDLTARWAHLALVNDGAGTASLVVNGQVAGSWGAGASSPGSHIFSVGAFSGAGSQHGQIKVADLRIDNVALTAGPGSQLEADAKAAGCLPL